MYLTGATLPPRDTQYVRDSYLGFESLTGRETLLGPRVRVGPFSIGLFFLLTAVGLVSLSLAAGYLFLDPLSRCRSGAGARTRGYTSLSPGDQAGLCGLTLLGLLVVQPFPFDRYLIPIIPVVAMCLLSRMPRRPTLLRSPTAMGLLAVFAVLSLVGTQDYLVRARTRWQAVDYLLESGVEARDIRAGFEHAALYGFAPRYRQPTRVRPYLLGLPEKERRARIRAENPLFVWTEPRPYEVAYDHRSARSGIEPVKMLPWRSWVRSGSVFIHHRPLVPPD
jgi:hypothetical protein